jgi:hypothetical protein
VPETPARVAQVETPSAHLPPPLGTEGVSLSTSRQREVISVLDDLPEQLDGHNRERIEKLSKEFHRLLASSETLLKSLGTGHATE